MKTTIINDYNEVKNFLKEHNFEYIPRHMVAFKFADLENEVNNKEIIEKLENEPDWLN